MAKAKADAVKALELDDTTRHQSFIVTGINFPTLGCWEITARYENDELTFVLWIAK
jgi:hypothetical protein